MWIKYFCDAATLNIPCTTNPNASEREEKILIEIANIISLPSISLPMIAHSRTNRVLRCLRLCAWCSCSENRNNLNKQTFLSLLLPVYHFPTKAEKQKKAYSNNFTIFMCFLDRIPNQHIFFMYVVAVKKLKKTIFVCECTFQMQNLSVVFWVSKAIVIFNEFSKQLPD